MPICAYSYLQDVMKDAEPSFGYYALAVLLENTENKLVITTNFDSLVEESLSLYHAQRPLVIGHESLAPFMNSTENMRRPMIAKVHRDLLLHPKNGEGEVERLDEGWANPLRSALLRYTPIVIGYAGGDKTLMTFLESLHLDTVYWCTLGSCEDDEDERIKDFLNKQDHGYLVSIEGFDEVLYGLLDTLMSDKPFDKPDTRIRMHAIQRAESYLTRLAEVVGSIATLSIGETEEPNQIKDANVVLVDTETRESDSLPSFVSQNSAPTSSLKTLERLATSDASVDETDRDSNDRTAEANLEYIKGVRAFNDRRLKDALNYLEKAVRLEPQSSKRHFAYGVVLYEMKRYVEAAKECRIAVEMEPDNAEHHFVLGATLHELGRFSEALAEKICAADLEMDNARYHESLGTTYHALNRYEEALAETDEALRLNPSNPRYYQARGVTLDAMGRHEEAEQSRKKAMRLDPECTNYYVSRGSTPNEVKLPDSEENE